MKKHVRKNNLDYLRKKGYGNWINTCKDSELIKYCRLELQKSIGGNW